MRTMGKIGEVYKKIVKITCESEPVIISQDTSEERY